MRCRRIEMHHMPHKRGTEEVKQFFTCSVIRLTGQFLSLAVPASAQNPKQDTTDCARMWLFAPDFV
jgi:hypothetical protein